MRIPVPKRLLNTDINCYSQRNEQEFDYILAKQHEQRTKYFLFSNRGSLTVTEISLSTTDIYLGKALSFPYIHFFFIQSVESYNVVSNLFEKRITYKGDFPNIYDVKIVQLKDYFSLGYTHFYRYDSVTEIDLTTSSIFPEKFYSDSNIIYSDGWYYEVQTDYNGETWLERTDLDRPDLDIADYVSDLYTSGRVILSGHTLSIPDKEDIFFLEKPSSVTACGDYIFVVNEGDNINVINEGYSKYLFELSGDAKFTSLGIYFITNDVDFIPSQRFSSTHVFKPPCRFVVNTVINFLERNNIDFIFASNNNPSRYINFTGDIDDKSIYRKKVVNGRTIRRFPLENIGDVILCPVDTRFLKDNKINTVVMINPLSPRNVIVCIGVKFISSPTIDEVKNFVMEKEGIILVDGETLKIF